MMELTPLQDLLYQQLVALLISQSVTLLQLLVQEFAVIPFYLVRMQPAYHYHLI